MYFFSKYYLKDKESFKFQIPLILYKTFYDSNLEDLFLTPRVDVTKMKK